MSDAIEALLSAVPDPLWIVGHDFAIARSNPAFTALSAKGFDVSSAWWRDLARRVLAGRSVSADTHAVIDGVQRTFAVTGTPAGDDGAVFLARDITDVGPVEREDNLELAVTRMFEPEKPLDQSLEDVLLFLCESDGWDGATIQLVDPAMNIARPSARPPGDSYGAITVPLHDAERTIGVLEVLPSAERPMSEQRRRALARAGASLGRLIARRRLQELIERKGWEWSLTFDAIALPVFIVRFDGTIARLNRAARDLVGGAAFRDILGRSIHMSESEPWITLRDTVAAVRDSGTPCTAQVTAGDRRWDISASWYRSAADDEERVIIVMRDTTDIVRLQDSVRRGEQLAALGELVAGVAHEVRNPIFGLGLTVDALQEMLPPDDDVAELYGILRVWLDRLNRLMESLLEYGKTWTLDLREGTVDRILGPVIDGCRQIAEGAAVAVEAEIEPDLTMLMDSVRLAHAFENVIMNAIQHSKPQQRVTVVARRDGDGVIECVVRDRGPGFNASDLPRVFQPFFTKRRGGTGLGLSIVQRIVDEHGGTIAATNAEGGGALLTMRFPLYKGSHRGSHVV